MTLNWQNLRPWNGTQNAAFEELCCQLAAHETVPPGATFIRKAPPDAGVECFWKLADGTEWGWQAKFFLSVPDPGQWRQLDESVRTALEKHPRLTTYTICLPLDRSDPRVENQHSFMDRWNEHVAKWGQWAKAKGTSVEFPYWGEHEVWDRLSRSEHPGRYTFWFNAELFRQDWFETHIAEVVANAGPRYTPELNVELPIAKLFDGLGRTADFFKEIQIWRGKIARAHSKIVRSKARHGWDTSVFEEAVTQLEGCLKEAEGAGVETIPLNEILDLCSQIRAAASLGRKTLEELAKRKQSEAGASNDKGTPLVKETRYEDFAWELHHLEELSGDLYDLEDWCRGREAQLANLPALLVIGDAGTGKTHLFCDVAQQRINKCLPSVVLLGEQFNATEPWSQMLALLHLSCDKHELLGALDAAAEAQGGRALILIDALNEGEGKRLWKKHIAGLLLNLSRYPRIGVALSVRASYEDLVIPEGLVPRKLVRANHSGFVQREYQATKAFFDHYKIELPSVPPLIPDFQNPQFLMLFCKALNNRGLTKIPPGVQGITAVYRFFIDSINSKLSRPEHLDFNPADQVVWTATRELSQLMAIRQRTWIPREEAERVVNQVLPRLGYEDSLFRNLVAEGLLAIDRYPSRIIGRPEYREGVRFGYERFTDHVVVESLLEKNLDPVDPVKSFAPEATLGQAVKDERACWLNRGLVEALCVQVPERLQRELVEVAPYCANFEVVRFAFIDSLVFRDPRAVTKGTLDYVNSHVIGYSRTRTRFLEVWLTVSSNPDHRLNADFLHKHLMKFEIAERDVWWSTFLADQFGEHAAVDRLVDWASAPGDKSHVGDESLRLCSMALSWFLTTSNRYLRDRATKALVRLLGPRIPVLRQVIATFIKVNDPYVLERLFAVAYGCAMRSTDRDAVGELASDVYSWIFKDGSPPPHFLLRDYARGIIEVALNRGARLEVQPKKIRPPYNSKWPSRIASRKSLSVYGESHKDMPDEEWARVDLYDSVMGSGDFARYIIGTNSGMSEWSSRRLNAPRKPSKQDVLKAFIESLTPRQRKKWKAFESARMLLSLAAFRELGGVPSDRTTLGRTLAAARIALRQTLTGQKLALFDRFVAPYLKRGSRNDEAETSFDLPLAQRWILKKVMDLGWSVQRFGGFDRNVALYRNRGRESKKAERIGKKYQWIAYHEFLARLSDNFEFKEERWSRRPGKYQGPWQMFRRDIDPSCLLAKTCLEEYGPQTNTWWFPSAYDAWDIQPDDVEWVKSVGDLPRVESLFEVTNPSEQSRWLTLESFYRWEQPTPIEVDRFEVPRRDIWVMLRSYLVRKRDVEKAYEWAINQDYGGRWMPESHEFYQVFLGELPWAPAFDYHDPYRGHDGWTDRSKRGNASLPTELLVPAAIYTWEGNTYDCSVEDTIHIHLPCKWLAGRMGLCWNGVEGELFDKTGKLVAFDPSVRTAGPGALLLHRDTLLTLLEENQLDILWTVLGEKLVLGRSLGSGEWKGRLNISGAYRFVDGRICGRLNTRFESPDRL